MKRFIQAACIDCNCEEILLTKEHNQIQTLKVHILTDAELKAERLEALRFGYFNSRDKWDTDEMSKLIEAYEKSLEGEK